MKTQPDLEEILNVINKYGEITAIGLSKEVSSGGMRLDLAGPVLKLLVEVGYLSSMRKIPKYAGMGFCTRLCFEVIDVNADLLKLLNKAKKRRDFNKLYPVDGILEGINSGSSASAIIKKLDCKKHNWYALRLMLRHLRLM